MGKSKNRLYALIIAAAVAIIALILIVPALKDQASLFVSPAELRTLPLEKQTDKIRLGGYVSEGSINKEADGVMTFIITDFQNDVPVRYKGTPPDLFREGQGVYVEGKFNKNRTEFIAENLLAKHDENYEPPMPGAGE